MKHRFKLSRDVWKEDRECHVELSPDADSWGQCVCNRSAKNRRRKQDRCGHNDADGCFDSGGIRNRQTDEERQSGNQECVSKPAIDPTSAANSDAKHPHRHRHTYGERQRNDSLSEPVLICPKEQSREPRVNQQEPNRRRRCNPSGAFRFRKRSSLESFGTSRISGVIFTHISGGGNSKSASIGKPRRCLHCAWLRWSRRFFLLR